MDAINALNWCAGHRGVATVPGSEATSEQLKVQSRITGLVQSWHGEDAIPSEEAAFKALIRGRTGYATDAAGTRLASCQTIAKIRCCYICY